MAPGSLRGAPPVIGRWSDLRLRPQADGIAGLQGTGRMAAKRSFQSSSVFRTTCLAIASPAVKP